MDKDRVAGSAKKIKGSIKEVVGKTAGNAKLEAEGKADKVEGKVQNAVGGLKDKATSQRKTSQRVSQSASPPSHTRLAKPSRSRRSSDGSHVTETDLISVLRKIDFVARHHLSCCFPYTFLFSFCTR